MTHRASALVLAALAIVVIVVAAWGPVEDWLFRGAGGRGCYGCREAPSTTVPPPTFTRAEKIAAACGHAGSGRVYSLPGGERVVCH